MEKAEELLALENSPLKNPTVWKKVDLETAESVKKAIDEAQKEAEEKRIKELREELAELTGKEETQGEEA